MVKNFQTSLTFFSLKTIIYFYKDFKNLGTKTHKTSQSSRSESELILLPPIAAPLQTFLILANDATIQPLAQAINLWAITLNLSFPTSLHHPAFYLIDSINLVDSTSCVFLSSAPSSTMDVFMTTSLYSHLDLCRCLQIVSSISNLSSSSFSLTPRLHLNR